MSRKYVEVMDKVILTENMRSRVMENVRAAEQNTEHRAIRFPNIRRYAAFAACLAIVLLGTIAGPKLLKKPQIQPPIEGANGIVACASINELSKAVGFPVDEVSGLPFTPEKTSYYAYWGDLAEIDYQAADGQTAVYRKSMGTQDNSGDWSAYDSTQTLAVGDITAQLKENGGVYTLAIWTNGSCAYSLNLSGGLDEAGWTAVIDGIE